MKLLLDTHTFIWLEADPSALSAAALQAVIDPTNDLYLSHVSLWEIQIKASVGKLGSTVSMDERIRLAQAKAKIALLSITLDHIYALHSLPLHHRDPFDRMLIAQASFEQLTLVSKDAALRAYAAPLLW